MESNEARISREEAMKRCNAVASVVPGATVRKHAWNITVIARSGKHLLSYTGTKQGFKKAGWAA